MKVVPISTPVVKVGDSLKSLILTAIGDEFFENSILVVTSKIIGLCESAVRPIVTGEREEKHQLVQQEAQQYLDPNSSKYDLMLTIKNQILAVNAGIDESNADGQYVLFPEEPYLSAGLIRSWLVEKFKLKNVGVLITDSKTFPLKWGQIGTMLAYSGFRALNDKRGNQDIFGRELKITVVNVAEALAAAAVLEMGEADEKQPLAVISDAKMVVFDAQAPTSADLENALIEPIDDAYAPLLSGVNWKKGGKYGQKPKLKDD